MDAMSIASTSPRNDAFPNQAGFTERLAYGVEEFAELLGIGRTTAFNLIKDGRIKAIKLGARTLIPASEAQALIQSLLTAA